MNENELKSLFEVNFKVDLLKLVGDRVPNVRLCLARCIRNHFKQISGAFTYDRKVNEAVNLLKEDRDSDVKAIVTEIMMFQQGIDDTSSESSRNSLQWNATVDGDSQAPNVENFLDSLQEQMEARGDLDLSMMSEGSVKTESEEVKSEPAAEVEPEVVAEAEAVVEAEAEAEAEEEAQLEDKLASEEADGNFGHLD